MLCLGMGWLSTPCHTRWSVRADATRPVITHYPEIVKALTDICTDAKQTLDKRLQADGLIEQLETALLTVIWHTILKSLHEVEIDLLSAVKLYNSLIDSLYILATMTYCSGYRQHG